SGSRATSREWALRDGSRPTRPPAAALRQRGPRAGAAPGHTAGGARFPGRRGGATLVVVRDTQLPTGGGRGGDARSPARRGAHRARASGARAHHGAAWNDATVMAGRARGHGLGARLASISSLEG